MQQQKELKEQLELNRPKVEAIREKEEQKVKQKYELLEKKRNYLQEREDRINIAVESYSTRPIIDRDPERVRQETVANTLSKNVIMDKADKVELFKNPGFTIDNLMKDMRYKVSAALSEAGLSNTSYAKQLMTGLESNLKPRRDMLSNI